VTLLDVQHTLGLENGFLIGNGYYGSIFQTIFSFMFLGTVACMVGDGFIFADTYWRRGLDEGGWVKFFKRLL